MSRIRNTEPPVVAPSVLSADFSNIRSELDRAEEAGGDWIHVDPMDGHFVPNLTIGPMIVEAMRPHTDLPLDVHLMLENPGNYLDQFIEAGADLVSFHVEAMFDRANRRRDGDGWYLSADPPGASASYDHARALIDRCHEEGASAGIVLNPPTPVPAITPLLDLVDLVLVMTVWPGFGGQSFMREPLDKVHDIRHRPDADDVLVEVDGGVSPDTAAAAGEVGADVFVAGSSTFGAAEMGTAVSRIREQAKDGRGRT